VEHGVEKYLMKAVPGELMAMTMTEGETHLLDLKDHSMITEVEEEVEAEETLVELGALENVLNVIKKAIWQESALILETGAEEEEEALEAALENVSNVIKKAIWQESALMLMRAQTEVEAAVVVVEEEVLQEEEVAASSVEKAAILLESVLVTKGVIEREEMIEKEDLIKGKEERMEAL
jgi:hypothetical protein